MTDAEIDQLPAVRRARELARRFYRDPVSPRRTRNARQAVHLSSHRSPPAPQPQEDLFDASSL